MSSVIPDSSTKIITPRRKRLSPSSSRQYENSDNPIESNLPSITTVNTTTMMKETVTNTNNPLQHQQEQSITNYGNNILGRALAKLRTLHESDWPSTNYNSSTNVLVPPSLSTTAISIPFNTNTLSTSMLNSSSVTTANQNTIKENNYTTTNNSNSINTPILDSPKPDKLSTSLASRSFSTNRLTASSIMNTLANHTSQSNKKFTSTIITSEPSFLPPAILSSAPPNTVLQAVGSYLIPLPLAGGNTNLSTQSLLSSVTTISNSRGSRRSPLVSKRSLFTDSQGIVIRNTEEENNNNNINTNEKTINDEKYTKATTKKSPGTNTRNTHVQSPNISKQKSGTLINSSVSPVPVLSSPVPLSPNTNIIVPATPLPSSPTLLRSLLHRPMTTSTTTSNIPTNTNIVQLSAQFPPSIQYRSILDTQKQILPNNMYSLGGGQSRSQSLPLQSSSTFINTNDNNTINLSANNNNRYRRFTQHGRSLSPLNTNNNKLVRSPPTSPTLSPRSPSLPQTNVLSPEPVPRNLPPQPLLLPSIPEDSKSIVNNNPTNIVRTISPNKTNRLRSQSPPSNTKNSSKVHWNEVFSSSPSPSKQYSNQTTLVDNIVPLSLEDTTKKPVQRVQNTTTTSNQTKTDTKNNYRSSSVPPNLISGTSNNTNSHTVSKAINPSQARSSSVTLPGRHSAIRAANRATVQTQQEKIKRIIPPPIVPTKDKILSSPVPKINRTKLYAHVRSSGYSNNKNMNTSLIQNTKLSVTKLPAKSTYPLQTHTTTNEQVVSEPSSTTAHVPNHAPTVPLSPPDSPIPTVSEDERILQEELQSKLLILKQEGRFLQSQLSEAKINQETAIADAAIGRVEYEECKAKVSTLSRERDAYKLRWQAAQAVLEEQNKKLSEEELTISMIQGIKVTSLQNRVKRLQNEEKEILHHIDVLQNEVIPELELDKVRLLNKQEEYTLLRKSVQLMQQGKLVNAPKQTRIQIRITQKKYEDEIREFINAIDQLINDKEHLTDELIPLRRDTIYHHNRLEEITKENNLLKHQRQDIQNKRQILRDKQYITEPLTLGLPIRPINPLLIIDQQQVHHIPTNDDLRTLFQTVHVTSQPSNIVDADNSEQHNTNTENDDTLSIEESLVMSIKDTETQAIIQPLPKLSGAALVRSVLADAHLTSLLTSKPKTMPTTMKLNKEPKKKLEPKELINKEINQVSDRLLSALAMADKAIHNAKQSTTIASPTTK